LSRDQVKFFIMKDNESDRTIDKDIVYFKRLKAGSKVYYLDVKRNQRDDMYVTITESKKSFTNDKISVAYEKHKIFLFREDFDKFMEGMKDVIDYIKQIRKYPDAVNALKKQ